MSKNVKGKLTLGMRCGDCLFFKRTRIFDDVCSRLGVESHARACDEFSPDHYKLGSSGEATIAELGKIVRRMEASQLRLMAFTFRNISYINKAGFKFGDRIAINLSAPGVEYVECFYQGRIIGADANGENIIVSSEMDKTEKKPKPTIITLPTNSDSYMRWADWKEKKATLVEEKKVKLPASEKNALWKNRPMVKVEDVIKDDYQIPTIDSVPDSWWTDSFDVAKPKRPKKQSPASASGKKRKLSEADRKVAFHNFEGRLRKSRTANVIVIELP